MTINYITVFKAVLGAIFVVAAELKHLDAVVLTSSILGLKNHG